MGIYMQIWYKYLLQRFMMSVIFLTLLCFSLFICIDLITHIKELLDPTTRWRTWIIYYACMLSYRLDILLPFAVATATSLLLPRLIRNNELTPLFNAGLALKTISRPFFVVAACCSILLLTNTQYIFPHALQRFHAISASSFGRKKISSHLDKMGVILCKDGSRLFFGCHFSKKRQLKDVFWVRTPDCIFHIEQLNYFADRPVESYGIDVIERTPNNDMKKTASYPYCEIPDLMLTPKEIKTAASDPKELSISQLAFLVPRFGNSLSERASEARTLLFQKLLSPLLALLAFLFPAPLCLRFERRFPHASLVFFSLALLFCFMIAAQAFVVLTRAPLSFPASILLVPWLAALFIGMRRVKRLL